MKFSNKERISVSCVTSLTVTDLASPYYHHDSYRCYFAGGSLTVAVREQGKKSRLKTSIPCCLFLRVGISFLHRNAARHLPQAVGSGEARMPKTWSSPETHQASQPAETARDRQWKRSGKEEVMGSSDVNSQPRGETRREGETNV